MSRHFVENYDILTGKSDESVAERPKNRYFAELGRRLERIKFEHDENYSSLQRLTEKARLHKGTGYNYSQIRRWHLGIHMPAIDYIVWFCQHFSIEPNWLLFAKGSPLVRIGDPRYSDLARYILENDITAFVNQFLVAQDREHLVEMIARALAKHPQLYDDMLEEQKMIERRRRLIQRNGD